MTLHTVHNSWRPFFFGFSSGGEPSTLLPVLASLPGVISPPATSDAVPDALPRDCLNLNFGYQVAMHTPKKAQITKTTNNEKLEKILP